MKFIDYVLCWRAKEREADSLGFFINHVTNNVLSDHDVVSFRCEQIRHFWILIPCNYHLVLIHANEPQHIWQQWKWKHFLFAFNTLSSSVDEMVFLSPQKMLSIKAESVTLMHKAAEYLSVRIFSSLCLCIFLCFFGLLSRTSLSRTRQGKYQTRGRLTASLHFSTFLFSSLFGPWMGFRLFISFSD